MDEIPIPTEAATEYSCPTEAATEAPTEAPSESSCPVATEAPTEAPSESSCPVATEAPTESSCPLYEDDEYLGEEIPIPPIPANDTVEQCTAENTHNEYYCAANDCNWVMNQDGEWDCIKQDCVWTFHQEDCSWVCED